MNIDKVVDVKALVVGEDFGGTQLRVGVLCGPRLLSRVPRPTSPISTPDHLIPCIVQTIQYVL